MFEILSSLWSFLHQFPSPLVVADAVTVSVTWFTMLASFSFKCSISEFWLINWLILCWRIRFLGFRKHSSSSHSLCFVMILLEAFFSNTKLASFSDISNVNSDVDSAERKDSQIETVAVSERDYRLRGGSMNEQSSSATPGSQTSTTSSDSGWFCCLSTFSATDLIYSWSDLCRMQK